jgi:hypothetical protein
MIAILAEIIVVCLLIGFGIAALVGAMTLVLRLLNLLVGIVQTVGEAAVWAVYWLLELDVRERWKPWKHWHAGFDGDIDLLKRFDRWRHKRKWARMCIYCTGLRNTKLFGTHYAHAVCEHKCG